MNFQQLKLCTSFYDFKDMIDKLDFKGTNTIHELDFFKDLKVNKDSITLTLRLSSHYYDVEFKKNELVINMTYSYEDSDEDIMTEANGHLVIKENQVVQNTQHYRRQDWYGINQNNNPFTDAEIDKIIEGIAKVVKYIKPDIEAAHSNVLSTQTPDVKACDVQPTLPEPAQPIFKHQKADNDEPLDLNTKILLLSAQYDCKLIHMMFLEATKTLSIDTINLVSEPMDKLNTLIKSFEAANENDINIKARSLQVQNVFGLINQIDGLFKIEETYQAGIGATINRQLELLKERIVGLRKPLVQPVSSAVSAHFGSGFFSRAVEQANQVDTHRASQGLN